jgi:hypothetical protein
MLIDYLAAKRGWFPLWSTKATLVSLLATIASYWLLDRRFSHRL